MILTSYIRGGSLAANGGMIPEEQLYDKLGGDHGKCSMKFTFELANLKKPNSRCLRQRTLVIT